VKKRRGGEDLEKLTKSAGDGVEKCTLMFVLRKRKGKKSRRRNCVLLLYLPDSRSSVLIDTNRRTRGKKEIRGISSSQSQPHAVFRGTRCRRGHRDQYDRRCRGTRGSHVRRGKRESSRRLLVKGAMREKLTGGYRAKRTTPWKFVIPGTEDQKTFSREREKRGGRQTRGLGRQRLNTQEIRAKSARRR